MPGEHLWQGGSVAPDPWAMVVDVYGQVGGSPTAFALIFCSPRSDRIELAAATRLRFGELPVPNYTTTGGIKPFGFVSGGRSGVGSPAGDFVVAATLTDVPYHVERD